MLTFCILAFLYFLPSILAHRKRSFTAIFLVNALLGWTVIGWIVALVWACTDAYAPPQVVVIPAAAAPGANFCGACGAPASSSRCPHCGRC